MSGSLISITATGVENLNRDLQRAASSGVLQKACRDALKEALPPSVIGTMQGRASGYGRMQGKAAGGLGYQTLPDGVGITLSGPFAKGAEFGGRMRPKKSYVYTSRAGRRYAVRRRATQQFLPHLGIQGYWMWPTIEDKLQGIRKKLIKAMIDEVS